MADVIIIKAYPSGRTTTILYRAVVVYASQNVTLSSLLQSEIASDTFAFTDEHILELKTSGGLDVKKMLPLPVSVLLSLPGREPCELTVKIDAVGGSAHASANHDDDEEARQVTAAESERSIADAAKLAELTRLDRERIERMKGGTDKFLVGMYDLLKIESDIREFMLDASITTWDEFIKHKEKFKNGKVMVNKGKVQKKIDESDQKDFFYVIDWFESFEGIHDRPAGILADFTKEKLDRWKNTVSGTIADFINRCLCSSSESYDKDIGKDFYQELKDGGLIDRTLKELREMTMTPTLIAANK